MTWIKICGITTLEDALAAARAGANAVGFVFYEPSPRNIKPEIVRSIAEQLPEETEKIGVFVNEPADRVSRIADLAGLTAVQLHGDEYRDTARLALNRRVLLNVPADSAASDDRNFSSALAGMGQNLIAILVDSGSAHKRGGTGRTFRWESSGGLISRLEKLRPVVVAGGLKPDNVREAIRILHPWGVDVSSGVEAGPGRKDPDKIRAFIEAVRLADVEHLKN